MKRLVFALIFFAYAATPASAQNFTWTSFATSNWNSAANWDTMSVPTSSATTNLFFNGILDSAYQANNDLGLFQLNNLTLNNQAGGTLTVNNNAGSSLQFAANGGIAMNGPGAVTISGTTVDLAGPMTISGGGSGVLTISSQVTGAGSLNINRTTSNFLGVTTLSSATANSFGGGITLTSGILSVATSSTNVGGGTVTIATTGIGLQANGEFRSGTASQTFNNPFTINNGATFNVSTGSTYVIGSGITGQGGFNIGNLIFANNITLEGANSFSGPTSVRAGTIQLRGNNGALSSTQIDLFRNASLTLDSNTATTGTGNAGGNQTTQDRILDNAVVNFNRTNFNMTANTAASTTETIGTLNNSGWGIFNLTAQPNTGATLTVNNLNRVGRGNFEFRGANLGANASGTAASTNVIIGNIDGNPAANALVGGGGSAGTPMVSILPFATGSNATATNGNNFVTIDGNGVRLLNTTTEFATTLPVVNYQNAAVGNNNVRVGTIPLLLSTQPAPAQTNALLIDGANGGVYGFGGLNGSLNIRSGALANPTSTGFIGLQELGFNGGEGVITANGTLVINSALVNNTGLTVAGVNRVSFTNANSDIDGPITINFGTLQFNNQAQLGGATSINFNGGFLDTGNLATGTSDTLSTPLNFGPAGGIIRLKPIGNNANGTSQSLTLTGAITGSGPLQVNSTGLVAISGGGTLIMNGDASGFSGPMVIVAGTVQVDSDARLGTNSFLSLGNTSLTTPAQLHVTGTTTSNKNFQLNGLSFFRTDVGATYTVTGTMTGTQAGANLTKLGAGELLLTNEANYGGATLVGDTSLNFSNVGGTLRLRDQGAIVNSPAFTVNPGSTLIADNTGSANLSNRLNNVTMNLAGGSLRLLGSNSAASTEILGPMMLTANSGSIVEVVPGATQNAALYFSGPTTGGYVRNNGSTVTFRAPGLGGTGAGQGQINFIHNNAAPTGPVLTNGILAHAFGEDGAAFGMTTVDTVPAVAGVFPQFYRTRLLTAGEYATDAFPSGVVQATNDRLTMATAPAASSTVNSLFIDVGGSLTNGVGNTATLTSGTMIMAGGTSVTGGTVATPAANDLSIYVGTGTATFGSNINLGSATRFLDKAGPGTLELTTAVTGTNVPLAVNVQRGTFRLGTGGVLPVATAMNVASGATFDVNGTGAIVNVGGLNGLGSVNLGSTAGTVLRLGGTNLASQFGGSITGTGSLEKAGTGIMTLTSTFNYNGPIALTGGTLRFGNAASSDTTRIPLVTGGTITASDGTIIHFGGVEDFARPIDVNVGAAVGTVTLNNNGGFGTNTRISGAINLAANKTLALGISSSGFGRISSNIGGDGAVNYNSFPNFIIDGNNTYTGTTTMSTAGSFGVGSDTAFGNGGTVTMGAAHTIYAFGGNRTVSNPILLNANQTFGTTVSIYQGDNLTFTGPVTMNAARTITTTAAGRLTLTDVGATGAFGIIKAGGGTLALAGTNTYSGTTAVNAGTLLVTGSLNAGGGTVTVATGAALGGNGTINRAVTANLLGSISPGESAGNLNVNGNLNFVSGSIYFWEMNANVTTGAGTSWDQLTMASGDLGISTGTALIPAFIGTSTVPNLIDSFWQSSQTWNNVVNLTGTATNTTGLVTFTIDNTVWSSAGTFSTIVASMGQGVDLVWTPVPEPASVLAICALGAGALGGLRRYRNKKSLAM